MSRPTEVIPTGPFETPPTDLGRLVTAGFDPAVDPVDVAAATAAWLLESLAECDVEVGTEDADVAWELAEDIGWAGVQVVAGWVARARTAATPGPLTSTTSELACARRSANGPNDGRMT